MTGAAALDGVEQWSIFGEGDHDKDCIHVDSQSIDVARKPYDAVAVKKKLNVEAIEYRQNLLALVQESRIAMDASVLGLEAYAEGPRRHPMTRRKLYKTSVSSRTANLELQHLSVFG